MVSLYHQDTLPNLLIWMMTFIYCLYFSYNYHKLLIIYYVLQSVLRSLQILHTLFANITYVIMNLYDFTCGEIKIRNLPQATYLEWIQKSNSRLSK